MSFAQTSLLGAVAGLTIFLGLPVALLKGLSKVVLSFLNAVAIGVLFFLFFDVMSNASQPVVASLHQQVVPIGLIVMLLGGFGLSLLGLVYYSRHVSKLGKGDIDPRRLAMLVAVGIGLHNFSEGLAIGSSSHAGRIALALTLIIGFGLHNITEGFGVAAPLADKKPSVGFLALAGLIAGGPTFIGAIVGYNFISTPISILFLTLAAGAIVFVLGELFAAGRRLSVPTATGWGLAVGLFAGFITDFILTAFGA